MDMAAVLVNYNDSERSLSLARMLSSFQLFRTIVIVDNNSREEERAKMKKEKEDEIVILYSKVNGGFGAGNNIGLRYLKEQESPFVVLTINPDIVPTKKACLDCYQFLSDHPEIAACSTLMTQKGKRTRNYYDIPTFSSTMKGDGNFSRRIRSREDHEGYFTCGFVRESFCFYRFDAFEKVGFFDENIFLYNEGATVAFQLEKLGFKQAIILDGEMVEHHHVGPLITRKGFKLCKKSRSYFLRTYRKEPEWKIRLFNLWWLNVIFW